MKHGLMTAAVLALILGSGLQASARPQQQQQNNNDAAQCAVGATAGGVIGGILGNVASKGDAAGTILGAGIGAVLGGAASCNDGNTNVTVNVGNQDNGYGRGGRGPGPGRPIDPGRGDGRGGDWGRGQGRPGSVVSYDLLQEAWQKAFNPRYHGHVVVQYGPESVDLRVQSQYRTRTATCIDYSMQEWGRGRAYERSQGTVCQDYRSGDVYEQ